MKTPLPSPHIISTLFDQLDKYDFLLSRDGNIVKFALKFAKFITNAHTSFHHITAVFESNQHGDWWIDNREAVLTSKIDNTRFSVQFLPLDEHFIYVNCELIAEEKSLSSEFLYHTLNSLPSDLAIFDLDHRYLF